MLPFWPMLVAFAGALLIFLLMRRLMRGRLGIQPRSTTVLINLAIVAGLLAVALMLQRFGVDILRKETRDILWTGLGIVWIVSAIRTAYQQRTSGAVLMDLGPAPMFKLHVSLAILMSVLAIVMSFEPASRIQALAFLAWAVWFLVMARGRFAVRDQGIVNGWLLPWRRITGCEAINEDQVRLKINRRLERKIDLKLPPGRRDEFQTLVTQRIAETRP